MSGLVLIVDDSPTMRNMVKTTMSSVGWSTITAQDGVKALKETEKQKVDLVITDINMPNMDGIEMITSLRGSSNMQSTPILIITTEGTDAMRNAGKAAGANGWIVKPFRPEVLIEAVKKITSK